MERPGNNEGKRWEDAMRQAFLMAGEGMPLRTIVAELAATGFTRPNGKPITLPTLWRHLCDSSYAGVGRSRRTFRVDGPVVSERLFMDVQARLADHRRNGMKQK